MSYDHPNTHFLPAGVVSPKGRKPRKIQGVIARRLEELGRLSGGIDPWNVSLVFESNSRLRLGC